MKFRIQLMDYDLYHLLTWTIEFECVEWKYYYFFRVSSPEFDK